LNSLCCRCSLCCFFIFLITYQTNKKERAKRVEKIAPQVRCGTFYRTVGATKDSGTVKCLTYVQKKSKIIIYTYMVAFIVSSRLTWSWEQCNDTITNWSRHLRRSRRRVGDRGQLLAAAPSAAERSVRTGRQLLVQGSHFLISLFTLLFGPRVVVCFRSRGWVLTHTSISLYTAPLLGFAYLTPRPSLILLFKYLMTRPLRKGHERVRRRHVVNHGDPLLARVI
jgi:hypothetical protein